MVEERHRDLPQSVGEQTSMKIRIRVNPPACTHQVLTLKGRFLTLRGRHLRRSRERYTCNACGVRVVRTLNTPGSSLAPDHPAKETNSSAPSEAGN